MTEFDKIAALFIRNFELTQFTHRPMWKTHLLPYSGQVVRQGVMVLITTCNIRQKKHKI